METGGWDAWHADGGPTPDGDDPTGGDHDHTDPATGDISLGGEFDDHDPLGMFGAFDDPASLDGHGLADGSGHGLADSATPEEPLALDDLAAPGGHPPAQDADFGHGGDTVDHDGTGTDQDGADQDGTGGHGHLDVAADHDAAGHEPGGYDGPGGHDHDAGGHDGPPPPDQHDPPPGDPGDDPDGPPPAAADMLHVGADPDVTPNTDDPTWADPQFPPALALGEPPQPVDGFPWSDPQALGDPGPDPEGAHAPLPSADATDLAAYAESDLPAGADAWAGLLASEDPATSSLARWWAPGT